MPNEPVPVVRSGFFADLTDAECSSGGASNGRWCDGENSNDVRPSGQDPHLTHASGPRAIVATAGGRYKCICSSGQEYILDVSCRGPRQRTASKAMMPSHAFSVSAHSDVGVFLNMRPLGLHHRSCVCDN